MPNGNCAKDMQSYSRWDELWNAAAVLPLYTVTGRRTKSAAASLAQNARGAPRAGQGCVLESLQNGEQF